MFGTGAGLTISPNCSPRVLSLRGDRLWRCRLKDAFFFLSLAGLGMSVAGLAGLVSAFRRGDQWDRPDLWRLRNIARLSFLVVFLALIVYPIYSFVGDEVATIRMASGTIAAVHIIAFLLVLRSFEPQCGRRDVSAN